MSTPDAHVPNVIPEAVTLPLPENYEELQKYLRLALQYVRTPNAPEDSRTLNNMYQLLCTFKGEPASPITAAHLKVIEHFAVLAGIKPEPEGKSTGPAIVARIRYSVTSALSWMNPSH